jgi:hypothetical protein
MGALNSHASVTPAILAGMKTNQYLPIIAIGIALAVIIYLAF